MPAHGATAGAAGPCMTDRAPPFVLRDSVSDVLSGQTLIAADQRYIDGLLPAVSGGRLHAASLMALPADGALPESALARIRVLVLEVDAGSETSLRRLAAIRAAHPDLAVIAAVEQAGVALVRALVRQGVADVAELPFAPAQLEEQLLDALSRQAAAANGANLGKAIAVAGASGGCGVTSLLTHLAAEIARQAPGDRGVCLLDLDLQKGSVASALGMEPKITIETLLDAGARLDRELMLSAVGDSGRGFSVLAAPDTIRPIDAIDVDHLLAIVDLARAEFDHVLIDLPPLWTDWTVSLASWAHHVIVLTDPAIANLCRARRTLALLASVDVPADRITVVVNRIERKLFGTTQVADIARALGRDAVATLADAGPALRAAQDQGALLPAIQGRTRYGANVADLARAMVSGPDRP